MKIQKFEVTGEGNFPLDMLRYDTCYPSTQMDVSLMGLTSLRVLFLSRRVQNRNDQPTIERWKSFGWTVGKVQTL